MNDLHHCAATAVLALEQHGYLFDIDDDGALTFEQFGDAPDLAIVRPLFDAVRADKAEAAEMVRQRRKYPVVPGIPWQTGDSETHTVVFPANSGLAFPAGSWKRLEDGRIEARLSLYDMRVMKAVRDAMPPENEKEKRTGKTKEETESERGKELPLPWEQ